MKMRDDYNRLAQEVIDCHNSIQQFVISIGAVLTTIAVTLPIPLPDANYYVGVQFVFNNGGYWITSKTATGFNITWVTATVGTQGARILVVR